LNIIIQSYNNGNKFYLKPDTSLNRDCNNYFCPETIGSLSVSPFIYIRIERAGKSILEKFAERYYKSGGYGISLKAVSYTTGENTQREMSNLLDNSTFLSPIVTGINNLERSLFNNALAVISNYISVRTGDIIAIETGEAKIYERGENIEIKEGKLSFEIIF
jgi:hypothetical protein